MQVLQPSKRDSSRSARWYFENINPTAGIVTVLNSAKRWTPVDKQELDKVLLFFIHLNVYW